MIIGLTGKNGAGKGEVASFLRDKSFYYYSLSDVIRDELESKNIPITRDSLIAAGNDLRQKQGPDILARLTLRKIDPNRNYVVDSIRNPAEVLALKQNGNFVLLNVDASPEVRFERIRSRAREQDPKTLEDFIRVEEAESKNTSKHKQSIEDTQALADFTIINDGSSGRLTSQGDRCCRQYSETSQTARLGSVLHVDCPGGCQPKQLRKAKSGRCGCQGQTNHFDWI